MTKVVDKERKVGKKGTTVSSERTKEIAVTGLFIALTFVFTYVNIKLPFGYGGLIHLGNIPLLLGAMLYGKRTGFLAGAFGMALFDVLSSWFSYAPCTFITCGLMGLAVGWITEKHKGFGFRVLAVAVALFIKLLGYYLFESVVYHSLVAPLASMPGNTLQVVLAAIPVLILIIPLEKVLNKTGLLYHKVERKEA